MKFQILKILAVIVPFIFSTIAAHAQNKNLEEPEGKAVPPTMLSLPPLEGSPPSAIGNSGAKNKDTFDLTGIDLKDPSSLLEVDEQIEVLPDMPNTTIPNFNLQAMPATGPSQPLLPKLGNSPPPILSATGIDPDADLANPEPEAPAAVAAIPATAPDPTPAPTSAATPAPAPASQALALPNLQPMTATAGGTLLPPTKPPVKTGPLVMAPSFFNPELKNEAACNPPPGTFTEKVMPPPTVPAPALKGISDVSIILSSNEFFPSKVLLKVGNQVRLIFTTVNKKPAALVIEKLQIQRWVAKEDEPAAKSELERSKFELTRELSSSRVTEVVIDTKPGTYHFHDVITGATGEIIIE